MNAGEYRAEGIPGSNIGGLMISPGPLSLVSAPPRDPVSTPPATVAPTATPGSGRDAPAAIPMAPAAPIGGLTLLVFAVPVLVNRRLRRWLLR